MGAVRAYQKKDVEAIAYYKRALALDPSYYICLENLADSNRRLGRVRMPTRPTARPWIWLWRRSRKTPASGILAGMSPTSQPGSATARDGR